MKGASFSEKKRKLSWDEKSHNIYFNKFSIVVCSFFLFNFLFRGRLWRRLLPWRRTLLQQGPLTWWYMNNILNFFLSVILGYILTLLLMLIFLQILFFLDSSLFDYLSGNRHILMQTNVSIMVGIAVFIPWAMVSFVLYKLMKRTILK